MVTVFIIDNGKATISAPTSITVSEGEAESFEVRLQAMPTDQVRITISGQENTDLRLTPTVLVFGLDNWSTAQTVTLNTVEDEDLVNDEVKLIITGSGGGYDGIRQELLVTIMDNLGVNIEESDLPLSVALWGNYPNPFSETTRIEFDLPAPAHVSVSVADILGRIVKNLSYGQFSAGGGHSVKINKGDLTSGIYYYTLKVDMDGELIERSKAMTIVR
ncbi:MAG: T9SS type A sorting domain-containing protein [Rhodothermaceae bacterium]|nr:T9SS type A sorting domain-containing protein [Rhodothermaceae bacterium]MYG70767.1 T9SS type A sorting domain-containing protein [Rhodothermaceae bacterium]MYJ44277.1 T9SS type A sorting domain-containing protein [Rhodothermaceae bacterium]